jgi:hypothetical protein
MTSGVLTYCMVKLLPQTPQKPRRASRDDGKRVGLPFTNRSLSAGNVIQVEKAAPPTLRHMLQWQCVTQSGLAAASKRIAPHKHPPVSAIVRLSR